MNDKIQIIKHYHEETKHHYSRPARALGFMDWKNQPLAFRRFIGAELILLSLQTRDDTPPYGDIFIRDKVKPCPISHETISKFMEYSLAISAWKQYGDAKWALRVNPSSGNLHPTEGYLILPGIEGINKLPGIYHYAPDVHGLEIRSEFSEKLWSSLPEGIFCVALTSIYWREAWKYGERAFRYCQHDCGHALMALDVAARMLGWSVELCPSIGDESISRILGLDRALEFREYEQESPELLAIVNLNPQNVKPTVNIPDHFINDVSLGTWYGVANPLSQEHHPWQIIDEAHQATLKPPTRTETFESGPVMDYALNYQEGFSAFQVIKKRRSAVDMDGQTSISKELFFRMLRRVGSSFQTLPWSPAVHLCLFVHRVDGVAPGLYMLVRDSNRVDVLKASMRRDFKWMKPQDSPEELMLYCLQEGDYRDISKSVSCGQDIARDGAFSLGMIALFDDPLNVKGPWFYKRLFWETGMIGQILYLEAEAGGISATGIGCFFDDAVHEILGLNGTQFQSLYHFTVGRAVVDDRLTTLPAYDR